MPAAMKKSPIADRLDKELGSDFENHKNDETTYGSGSDLPAGINGGLAQLVEAKVDEYKEGDNKGKLYLMLAGIVKSPEEHAGIKLAGLRAQKMLKLFANNKDTKDQAISKACNEVRKMGGVIGDIKARDLPALLDALKEEAPHFRFNTRSFSPPGAKKDDEPIIFTEFKGRYDGDVSSNNSSGVIDNTGAPADGGESQAAEEDWGALVSAAENDDGVAQAKLQNTCKAMGMTQEQIDEVPDWAGLAECIRNGGAATGGELNTEWKPMVGEEYSLKMKGMKSPQKLKVTKVLKTTLDLKSEGTGKEFLKVEWVSSPSSIGGVEI